MGEAMPDLQAALDAAEAALTQEDFTQLGAVLHEDVVLHSPALDDPWRGRPSVSAIGSAIAEVIEDARITGRFETGATGVLRFRGHHGGTPFEGVQILHVDEHAQVDEVTLAIRPLGALIELARAMRDALPPALLAGHGS
jgi:hypothetical protein